MDSPKPSVGPVPDKKATVHGLLPPAHRARRELEELTALASQPPASRRHIEPDDLYHKLTIFYERNHHSLSLTESTLLCDILQLMLRDVDISKRQDSSERLAVNPKAPLGLILLLANDCIEVARPVLTHSTVLEDCHLLDLIAAQALQHRLCIAGRRTLSELVTATLVATGDRQLMRALLDNPGAALSSDIHHRILTCLNGVAHPRQPAPEALDTDADGEEATAARLIQKLYSGGQLSAAFLIKSLNQNQYALFEHAFACLLNLPVELFRKIQKDHGIDGLAMACHAVGIDRSVFTTIYRLSRCARALPADISPKDHEQAQDIFLRIDQRKAEIILHGWARDASRAPIF